MNTSHLGTELNLSITYDVMGNILRRNDVASGNVWTYDPVHKHQVTQAGSASFSYGYDANGNVISRNGSLLSWTGYSLLLDHQGSISTIVADATGTSAATESFSAFGNRREAATWSGSPTTTELAAMNGVTREGYTFQTVLGSMGLNHMNGRIEDSVTGRFLSADPHGIHPGNTQSFNRYSYALNNPVTFTDPTGFDEVCDECVDSGGGGGYSAPVLPPSDPPTGSLISGTDTGFLTTVCFTAECTASFAPPPDPSGLPSAEDGAAGRSGSSNDTSASSASTGSAGGSSASNYAAQSGQQAVNGVTGDSIGEIVVTAQGYGTSTPIAGSFLCGSFTCNFNLSATLYEINGGLRGALLQVLVPKGTRGARWSQTFIGNFEDDWDFPQTDCDTGCPFYTTPPGTPQVSSTYFTDQPARPFSQSGTWLAATSYLPLSGGGFSFIWGFSLSPNAITLFQPIPILPPFLGTLAL